MKSLLLSLVAAAAVGVVLSLPFNVKLLKKQALIPLARSLGATEFAHYVHEANLTANFTKKAGNFTLFIPVNKAWKDLSKNITSNKTLIRELILFHSVNGSFMRRDLKQGIKLRTLSGKFLTFSVTKDKSVLVDGVNITKYNQRASNGFIFLISEVLNASAPHNKTHGTRPAKPPSVAAQQVDKGKEALIPHVRSLGATKFAHFVHEADLQANFTKKAGNFTLFVPLNTAWESLSKNITGNKTLLQELILFHSVNGTYTRADLKKVKKLETLSGKFLHFNVTKHKAVFVNGVNITSFNNRASNGNIFLLAEVILNGSGVHNKTNTTTPTKALPKEDDEIHKGKEALIPHVRSLGATRFAHFVHEADLQANFTKKAGNFTLFVPINTAWESLSKNITGNKTLLRELILFHSVNGTYTRADLKKHKKLETLSGKFLHFNVTKHKAVFVNGVNITSFNNRASNGNIFLLAEVILNGSGVHNKTNTTTPTKALPKEVDEIHKGKEALIPHVRSLGATKFAHFVHEADLQANFTKKAGNFTLFVPINTAWESLSKNITGNKTLLRELILFHSVNGTYTRADLKKDKKLETLSGKFLHFNVTKYKAVFVNGVNITSFNNRASNGNIFLLAEVILNGSGVHNKTNTTTPTKALPKEVDEIHKGKEALIPHVRSLGATKFAHFVHEADLQANFTKKAGNFTLFVPINTAWESLSKNVTGNKTLLRELILFHSVNGTYTRADLKKDKKLETLSGKLLHFNVTKEKAVFVNGVNITSFNNWASNGNIFLISEVILNGSGIHNKTNITKPSEALVPLRRQVFAGDQTHGSITHILSKNWGRFSTLITDLMKTGVWSELEKDHVTLLAPTNQAFQSLSPTYVHNLDNDATFLKETLKYHVLSGVHSPSSLHQDTYLTTVEGHRVHTTLHDGHVSHFNKVPVVNVIHATNGYMYVLSGVLHVPAHKIV